MDAVGQIFVLNFTIRPEGEGTFDFLITTTGELFQRGYDILVALSRRLSPAANRDSVLLKVASLSLKIPICDEASPYEKRTLVWMLVNDVKEYLFDQLCEVVLPPQEIASLRRLLVESLDRGEESMRRNGLLTYEEAQDFFMCFPLFKSNVVRPTFEQRHEEMAGDVGEGSLDAQPPFDDSQRENLAGLSEMPRRVADPNFFVSLSQTNATYSHSLLARATVVLGFDEPGVAVQPAKVDGKFQEFFAKIIFDRVNKVMDELDKWNKEHPTEPQVDMTAVEQSLMRIINFYVVRFLELISRKQEAPPLDLTGAIKQGFGQLKQIMSNLGKGMITRSEQFVERISSEMCIGFLGCLHEFMSGATATTITDKDVQNVSVLIQSSCSEIAEAVAHPIGGGGGSGDDTIDAGGGGGAAADAAAALAAGGGGDDDGDGDDAGGEQRRVRKRPSNSPPPPHSGVGRGGSKSRKNTKRTRRHSKGRKSSKAAKKTQQRRSSRYRRSSRKGRK